MHFLFIPVLNSVKDIAWGLEELGHKVTILENTVFDPNSSNASNNTILKESLSFLRVDYVISPCFIPDIADICFANRTDVRICNAYCLYI